MKPDVTRRGFFKAGAAAAVASRIAIGRSEAASQSSSPSPVNGGTPHHAPFHRPPDVPPVKFIRENVPAAKVVEARGGYSDAIVPDTCDLEEGARLFIDNFLNSVAISELDDEPFARGKFDLLPPRLTLDSASGYVCGIPKWRESLPLLRIMSGSRQALDIDHTWAKNLLKCIGPDGLSYVPVVGRPWDQVLVDDWMPKGVEFYASLPVGNGRLLGSLANYYRMTGDQVWNQTGKGVVDCLNKLAVKVGDGAIFPKFFPVLGEQFSQSEIQKAIARMKEPTTGETELNTPMWQTWIITGLAQYYRVSGYEPAKDLAYRLVHYMRQVGYVYDWSRRSPGAKANHLHLLTLGVQAAMETALIGHDRELAEYARGAYEFVKSGEHMIALPDIGFFVNAQGENGMEGCVIGDMAALAVKLTQLGMGDQYWEDVDRYTRNCLMGTQITQSAIPATLFAKLAERGKSTKAPVEYRELLDRLPERLVGSFVCWCRPNDFFSSTYFNSCCEGNISRALYYVWQSIVKHENSELKVNLLLNRTSPWADIHSFIPYTGRVDFHVKKPLVAMKVRMNDWIDKRQVVCTVDGAKREHKWEGNYVVLGDVKPKQMVRIDFPIREQTKTLHSFGHRYNATFRGNDVVDIGPKGEIYPMFQRDHYRSEQPRYIRTKKFACDNAIDI